MAKNQEEEANRSSPSLPAKLASPARRALDAAGITHLDQLTTVTGAELTALHGMGPKALGQLRDALAATGRSFKDVRSTATDP